MWSGTGLYRDDAPDGPEREGNSFEVREVRAAGLGIAAAGDTAWTSSG